MSNCWGAAVYLFSYLFITFLGMIFAQIDENEMCVVCGRMWFVLKVRTESIPRILKQTLTGSLDTTFPICRWWFLNWQYQKEVNSQDTTLFIVQ